MDKEMFIEYIMLVFLVIVYFYSNFFINKNLLRINARHFLLQKFNQDRRILKEHTGVIKNIFNNFNNIILKKKY